jgi:hypothetical protein
MKVPERRCSRGIMCGASRCVTCAEGQSHLGELSKARIGVIASGALQCGGSEWFGLATREHVASLGPMKTSVIIIIYPMLYTGCGLSL